MLCAFRLVTATLLLIPLGPAHAAGSTPVEPVMEQITLERSDGTTAKIARVEPWPGGFVRVIRGNGEAEFISDLDVRAILDSDGKNVTQQVLARRKGVGTRPVVLRPRERPKGPPRFRGRPSPLQRGFTLVQAGFLGRIDDTPREAPNTLFVLDLGRMRNLSPRHSVGGSVFLATDDEYARVGLRPRYRRWLTRTIGIDLAPGMFLSLDGSTFSSSHSTLGFVGEASVSLGDWVAVTGQVEVVGTERRYYAPYGYAPEVVAAPETMPVGSLRETTSGTEVSWLLGARIGGEIAIPAVFLSLWIIAAMSGVSADY